MKRVVPAGARRLDAGAPLLGDDVGRARAVGGGGVEALRLLDVVVIDLEAQIEVEVAREVDAAEERRAERVDVGGALDARIADVPLRVLPDVVASQQRVDAIVEARVADVRVQEGEEQKALRRRVLADDEELLVGAEDVGVGVGEPAAVVARRVVEDGRDDPAQLVLGAEDEPHARVAAGDGRLPGDVDVLEEADGEEALAHLGDQLLRQDLARLDAGDVAHRLGIGARVVDDLDVGDDVADAFAVAGADGALGQLDLIDGLAGGDIDGLDGATVRRMRRRGGGLHVRRRRCRGARQIGRRRAHVRRWRRRRLRHVRRRPRRPLHHRRLRVRSGGAAEHAGDDQCARHAVIFASCPHKINRG